MVMAGEHGMYKRLAPRERARGVKNNEGASFICFVSAAAAKTGIPPPVSSEDRDWGGGADDGLTS